MPDDKLIPVVEVKDNYQRLRRHYFDSREVTGVRIHVTATNGSDTARYYEVRDG